MDGSNFNNNQSASIGRTQPIPHVSQPTGPQPKSPSEPKYTFTERAIGTTAVGTTTAGVAVTAYDVHSKNALSFKRFAVEVHTKAAGIREDFIKERITEKDAIYHLKNLQLDDQDIVKHLTSTGLFGDHHKSCYGIVNSKIVKVKVTEDGKMIHPYTANPIELEELNNMQGVLYERRGTLKQYKSTLPADLHLHRPIDEAINSHDSGIATLKEYQLLNVSQSKVERTVTANASKAVMEDVNFIMKETQKAIDTHLESDTQTGQGVPQQLVSVTPPTNSHSRQQGRSSRGPTGSITQAFLDKTQIRVLDNDSNTTYYKFVGYDLSNEPIYAVSEKANRSDTCEHVMTEAIPIETPQPSTNFSHVSAFILGLSTFLWGGFFYLRNKRLNQQERKFHEEERRNALGDVIKRFKRKELSFDDTLKLLIKNFNFTEPVARQYLLNL